MEPESQLYKFSEFWTGVPYISITESVLVTSAVLPQIEAAFLRAYEALTLPLTRVFAEDQFFKPALEPLKPISSFASQKPATDNRFASQSNYNNQNTYGSNFGRTNPQPETFDTGNLVSANIDSVNLAEANAATANAASAHQAASAVIDNFNSQFNQPNQGFAQVQHEYGDVPVQNVDTNVPYVSNTVAQVAANLANVGFAGANEGYSNVQESSQQAEIPIYPANAPLSDNGFQNYQSNAGFPILG